MPAGSTTGYTRCVFARLETWVLATYLGFLVACGAAHEPQQPAPQPVEASPVRCMRRSGGPRFGERIYFDAAGNILRTVREDRTLEITWHRDGAGALRHYEIDHGEPARAVSGTFQFGSHGELTGARLASADRGLDVFAELVWRGSFEVTAGTARPFAALGGAGGQDAGSVVRLLSENLTVRHASNPMTPVKFTGTVIASYPGRQGTDRYEYRDGRLLSYRGRKGDSERFTWSDFDEPIETVSCSRDELSEDASERCDTFRAEVVDGQLRSVIGGSLDLRYDDLGRLTSGTYRGSGDSVTWSDCAASSSR